MVKVKLLRLGTKHKPFYRIVVAEARSKMVSDSLEVIGFWDPRVTPPTIKIKKDRLEYWVNHGAQVTPSVKNIIEK